MPRGGSDRFTPAKLRLALIGLAVFVTISIVVMQPRDGSGGSRPLVVVSWNIAAVNNNPFEYWVTHEDPHYNRMMADVEHLIEEPGDADVPVSAVFTFAMFDDLVHEMGKLGWTGLDAVAAEWKDNYSGRRIISGFMKDPVLVS